jgi:hypothetical protein
MTQRKINNTFVKFMKSSSVAYEMNGEAYYTEWFETSLGEIGITPDVIKSFGSVEHTLNTLVSSHPQFKSTGYDLFKILNGPTPGTLDFLLYGE